MDALKRAAQRAHGAGDHHPHRRPALRPAPAFGLPRWQRLLLVAAIALLGTTGAAWLAVHWLLGAGAGELPHPAEPWLMRLHGLGAFVGLFAGGVIAGAHVPPGWRVAARQGTQRRSGIAMCALLAATVLSAYALYYFAPEAVRPALGWVHAGLGSALAALGVWHARRHVLRRRKESSRSAAS